MRTLLAALLVSAPLLAHAQVCTPDCAAEPAQCCNMPQADLFSALESDAHDTSGGVFRGVMPDNVAGAQCAVDSTITNLLVSIPQPGAAFETVQAPGLGGIVFAIKLKSEFATLTGALDGPGNPPAACFKLDVEGLVRVSPVQFTDGCGTHAFTIGQPKYACVLGRPIGKTLVCFAAKAIGVKAPLPPGFDRLEDVCALVDLVP